MSTTLLPIIPSILQVLPFVAAFSVLCAKALRSNPLPFYLGWTAVAVLATWGGLASALPAFDKVIQLLASSYVGVSFYLVVMFVGAFDRTPLVKRVLSVRSELSIIGGILVMGHLVRVFGFLAMSFTPQWGQIWGHPAAELMFAAAVLVGLPLTATFVVPWITSFPFVRARMSAKMWKRTQKLAYPFMFLMVAQGFLLALGHALYGYPFDGSVMMVLMQNPVEWLATFAQQVATEWTYLALGAGYAVLRLRKRSRDKARRSCAASECASSRFGAFGDSWNFAPYRVGSGILVVRIQEPTIIRRGNQPCSRYTMPCCTFSISFRASTCSLRRSLTWRARTPSAT